MYPKTRDLRPDFPKHPSMDDPLNCSHPEAHLNMNQFTGQEHIVAGNAAKLFLNYCRKTYWHRAAMYRYNKLTLG
jgi:hypothetical protein